MIIGEVRHSSFRPVDEICELRDVIWIDGEDRGALSAFAIGMVVVVLLPAIKPSRLVETRIEGEVDVSDDGHSGLSINGLWATMGVSVRVAMVEILARVAEGRFGQRIV